MNKIVSVSPLDAARAFTNQLIEWLNEDKDRHFYLAVSGGSTPMILFHTWKEEFRDRIDWARLQIYWVDERCVDPRHGDSNYGMTKKILLDHVPVKSNQVHRIIGEIDSHFENERYSREVMETVPLAGGIPRFDLILLGMGEDGHTASIFPSQENLYSVNEIYAVSQKPHTNSIRITMTGKIITHAKRVVFFITGAPKAQIIKEIFTKNEEAAEKYPANYFAKNSNNVQFYLDEGAASLLSI